MPDRTPVGQLFNQVTSDLRSGEYRDPQSLDCQAALMPGKDVTR